MVTIENLANWPNSDEHWSDIPGWPAEKWSNWGEDGDEEGGQPAKRKVQSPTHPQSISEGLNHQQMYQDRSFFGENTPQTLQYQRYPQQGLELSNNPYAINHQNLNSVRHNENHGLYQLNNIPQYQNQPNVQLKVLPDTAKIGFPPSSYNKSHVAKQTMKSKF